MGERQTIDGGKSIADAIEDMRNGISGETGFVSHTTGGVLYMRYAPLGVNNWNVMLTEEDKYALAESEYISNSLYTMATVIGSVLLIYVICVINQCNKVYAGILLAETPNPNSQRAKNPLAVYFVKTAF